MSEQNQEYLGTPTLSVAVTNLGAYNNGELRYQWVNLPVEPKEFQNSLKEIGIGETDAAGSPYEEYFISDYDSQIPEIDKLGGEYPDINTLNQIAKDYELLSETDRESVDAALELEEVGTLNELGNLLQDQNSIDGIRFFPGGADEETLGEDLIEQDWDDISEVNEETLELYFDYESFGRDVKLENPDEEDWQDLDDEDLGYELVEEVGWSGIGRDNLEQYFDYGKLGYNAKMELTGDNLGEDFVEFTPYFHLSDQEPIIDIDLLEREDREPEQTIVFGNGEQSPSKSEAVTQAKKPSQDPSLPKEKER